MSFVATLERFDEALGERSYRGIAMTCPATRACQSLGIALRKAGNESVRAVEPCNDLIRHAAVGTKAANECMQERRERLLIRLYQPDDSTRATFGFTYPGQDSLIWPYEGLPMESEGHHQLARPLVVSFETAGDCTPGHDGVTRHTTMKHVPGSLQATRSRECHTDEFGHSRNVTGREQNLRRSLPVTTGATVHVHPGKHFECSFQVRQERLCLAVVMTEPIHEVSQRNRDMSRIPDTEQGTREAGQRIVTDCVEPSTAPEHPEGLLVESMREHIGFYPAEPLIGRSHHGEDHSDCESVVFVSM